MQEEQEQEQQQQQQQQEQQPSQNTGLAPGWQTRGASKAPALSTTVLQVVFCVHCHV